MTMTTENPTANPDASHLDWINAARAEFERHKNRVLPATRTAGSGGHAWGIPQVVGDIRDSLPGYEIEHEISRGGQGVVYKGIQKSTRRHVAIKVLREGRMAGDQERVRFEREARILSQLKHPNIVTVHDSGSSAGNFYFIMDYIDGRSLDAYVRDEMPTIRERIKLFEKICQAVNIAHLRGIIHRDLKPSNIRVDLAGEPHVMDFGLAKVGDFEALNETATSMITTTGQFIGSLPWASPEQVSGRPEAVDIRTDVYALGIILYQMTTGEFPYEVTGQLREVLENICIADAPKPSRINKTVDDELDQIILKCLRKEVESRYHSAGDLARELKHYLAGEAISAKADSSWYVFRKTVKRHRISAAIGTLIILVTVGAVAWLIDSVNNQAEKLAIEKEASEELQEKLSIAFAMQEFVLEDMIAAAMPKHGGEKTTVIEAIDVAAPKIDERYFDQPQVAGSMHYTIGNVYLQLGRGDPAIEHLQKAIEYFQQGKDPDNYFALHATSDLAQTCSEYGKIDIAEQLNRKCLEARTREYGPYHADTLNSMSNLAWSLYQLGRSKEAAEMYEEVCDIYKSHHKDNELIALPALRNLAVIYVDLERVDEAIDMFIRAIAGFEEANGPDDGDALAAKSSLASAYRIKGDYEKANPIYEDVIERRTRLLGRDHPKTLGVISGLATLYTLTKDYESAASLYKESLDIGVAKHGPNHRTLMSLASNLAVCYDEMNNPKLAIPYHKQVLQAGTEVYPENHHLIGLFHSRLGRCQLRLSQFDLAEKNLLTGYDILARAKGENDYFTRVTKNTLAQLYELTGKEEESKKWRPEPE
jgi:serine/threonine protein kinase/tetratricopeptide (TPR) repeat protein